MSRRTRLSKDNKQFASNVLRKNSRGPSTINVESSSAVQQGQASVPPPWLKRLGGRIRQARRSRGLTQSSAAGAHLTKSFISLLESGRTYPSVTTLVALADRLQSSLALLLLDDERLPRETALSLLALARAKTADAPRADVAPLLAAVDVLAEKSDDLRIDCVLTRGDLAAQTGDVQEAEQHFEEALALARRRRLRTYEPRALLRLAHLALRRNDRAGARRGVDEALPLFRATRTLRSIDGCEGLILHGRLLIAEEKPTRALRVLEEVATVAVRHDLPRLRGKALQWIGHTYRAMGRQDRALDALRRAKEALSSTEEAVEFSEVLNTMGILHREAGNLEEAHACFQETLRVQERIGAVAEQANTLNEFAQLQLRRNRLAEAQRIAHSAGMLARTLHDPAQNARILVTMARIARAHRRWKAAADHLREAVDQFKKAKLSLEWAETARELGMLLKERGEHAEAANYLAIALSADRPPARERNPDNEAPAP